MLDPLKGILKGDQDIVQNYGKLLVILLQNRGKFLEILQSTE